MIVDDMYTSYTPELLKDIHWEKTVPDLLPYTEETVHLRKEEPMGGAEKNVSTDLVLTYDLELILSKLKLNKETKIKYYLRTNITYISHFEIVGKVTILFIHRLNRKTTMIIMCH